MRISADRADTWTLGTPSTGVSPPSGDTSATMTVTVNPAEIAADGSSTATATATVTRGGVGQPGYPVTFTTDGDVTFSEPSQTTDVSGRATVTVTASKTPGFEKITATTPRSRPTYLAPTSGCPWRRWLRGAPITPP